MNPSILKAVPFSEEAEFMNPPQPPTALVPSGPTAPTRPGPDSGAGPWTIISSIQHGLYSLTIS